MTRPITHALLALLACAGLLAYRTHLIDLGYSRATQDQQAALVAAKAQAAADAGVLYAKSQERLDTSLSNLKAQHADTVRHLSLVLADSRHRLQLLDVRIAGLLNAAAGLRAGTAATAGAPEPAPDSAEAAGGQVTVADLIENTADNYAICRANAQTLVELQRWYGELRASRAAPMGATE